MAPKGLWTSWNIHVVIVIHVCLHITLRVMTKIGNGFQSAVCLQSVQGDIYQVSNVVNTTCQYTKSYHKPHSWGPLRPSFFLGDSFSVLGEGGNYLFESSRNVRLKVTQSRALGSIVVGLFTYRVWLPIWPNLLSKPLKRVLINHIKFKLFVIYSKSVKRTDFKMRPFLKWTEKLTTELWGF